MNDTRARTIDVIERDIADAFPDWEVRRAFTSRMIIKKLRQRDGIEIDYITDAIQKLSSEGFEDVVVQPTHVMNGIEYEDVCRSVIEHGISIDRLSVGKPMLTREEDYDLAVQAIKEHLLPLCDGRDLILMGHGTEHYANAAYSMLQLKLALAGIGHVFVTTVEGFPSFEDTISIMSSGETRGVALAPFMIVAGDHAVNDMAGDDEDSLKSVLVSRGYDVDCIVRGLGEFEGFRRIFVEHVREAMGGEAETS